MCALVLASRALLRVAGDDAIRFLQRLVTVNVHRLCGEEDALFGAFLNRRGRVEHAAFLLDNGDGNVLIDCAKNEAPALMTHLKGHLLRAKVNLEIDDTLAVVVRNAGSDAEVSGARFVRDARLSDLHERAVVPAKETRELGEGDGEVLRRRIMNGIACAEDAHGALPLQLALHEIGGIDFDKGCYLGQELTARTHFTGVLRRRLTPVVAAGEATTTTLTVGEEVHSLQGKKVGQLSSATANCGLAVLRTNDAFEKGEVGVGLVTSGGVNVTPWAPGWWKERPSDASE